MVPRCAAPEPYPTPIPPIRTLDPITELIKPTPTPAAIIICDISKSSPSPIREPTAVYDNNSLSVAGQVEEGRQERNIYGAPIESDNGYYYDI